MGRNEYRDDEDGDDAAAPDAYWRRRAITLALGLGLLGILAWGFSGGGSKSITPLPATALATAVPGAPSNGPHPGSQGAGSQGAGSQGAGGGSATSGLNAASPNAAGQNTTSPNTTSPNTTGKAASP